MIQLILFSTRKEELAEIRSQIAEITLRFPWMESNLRMTTNLQEWTDWGKEQGMDALICDVGTSDAVEALEDAKRWNPQARVLPIAGEEIPPTAYVKPEILPFALVWRPLVQANIQGTLQSLLSSIYHGSIQLAKQTFQVRSRQKIQYIPYPEIYYFESRDKRVYLRTRYNEIVFQNTMGQLEKELPNFFLRCHRSYIVNVAHILEVEPASGLLWLDAQICVPLSRGYRSSVLEEINAFGTRE